MCTGQKNAGMYGEKHLARVQARIRAAGDHLVEITSTSGAPWRRALEREGRALASAVQHTRPSMQKMVTAGCPDPEGDPSRVHGPRVLWLQQPRLVMAGCDVTQARVGVQGRFLDASGSTLQPKYSPIGGAAQRRLAARARRQTISAFEPLICLMLPSPILAGRTKTNLRKIGRGSDSPHPRRVRGSATRSWSRRVAFAGIVLVFFHKNLCKRAVCIL